VGIQWHICTHQKLLINNTPNNINNNPYTARYRVHIASTHKINNGHHRRVRVIRHYNHHAACTNSHIIIIIIIYIINYYYYYYYNNYNTTSAAAVTTALIVPQPPPPPTLLPMRPRERLPIERIGIYTTHIYHICVPICFSPLPPARNFSPSPSPSPHLLANSLRSHNPPPYPPPTDTQTHLCLHVYRMIYAMLGGVYISFIRGRGRLQIDMGEGGSRSREWIDTAIYIHMIFENSHIMICRYLYDYIIDTDPCDGRHTLPRALQGYIMKWLNLKIK